MGSTYQEMCGALSGGVIIIGLMHGAAPPEADNGPCRAVAGRWRERFLETFGHTKCQDLRGLAGWAGNCRVLAGESAALLLEVLREAPEILASFSDEA